MKLAPLGLLPPCRLGLGKCLEAPRGELCALSPTFRIHFPKHAAWVGVGRVISFAQINCEVVALYFRAFMILIGSAV